MMQEVIDIISKQEKSEKYLLSGLDGFVDEIIHVVDKRIDSEHYERITTISEFGQRIIQSAGLSTNLEFVTVQRKLGGNGPIFASGLQRLGMGVTYVGAVGVSVIDPVFRNFSEEVEMIGLCEPAQTEALEFLDGKLICSKLASFGVLTWQRIVDIIGIERFAKLIDKSDVVSFNNWTMLTSMNECWKHILKDVLPLTKTKLGGKTLFFDLADPEKRPRKELVSAVKLIEEFHEKGFRTVLGLNYKEAKQVGAVKGISEDIQELDEITTALGKALDVDVLAVHQHKKAACYTNGHCVVQNVPYCEHPVLTTGAGDNFNAGFVYGYSHGMTSKQSLICGIATAGYYVRNGHSATKVDLCDFLRQWDSGAFDRSNV